MHGFELALPVNVELARTSEPAFPGSDSNLLSLTGRADHLSFNVSALYVSAFAGKHAAKRFHEAFHVREFVAL